MTAKGFLAHACVLAALLSGCASTHHVKFQPWQGLDPADAEYAKRGIYKVGPEALYQAVAKALEREPFLNWEFSEQEPEKGWLKADAGLFRLLQARVVARDGGSSELSLSLPRRTLDGRAQVWKKPDGGYTAYSPGDPQGSESIDVVFELDEPYLYSLIYRQLMDQSPVPFELLDNPEVKLEK
jgi:hypothetical protein